MSIKLWMTFVLRRVNVACSGVCLFPPAPEAVRISCNSVHYSYVRISTMASQITSLTIVYSTIYSGSDQGKHQSSASLAFVWGIHRWPVNSPHKWPVTRKMFSFHEVIMESDPPISVKFNSTLSHTWKAHKVKLSFSYVIAELVVKSICQIAETWWILHVLYQTTKCMSVILCYCFALFIVSGSNTDFIYLILVLSNLSRC